MRFEILVEDASGKKALKILIPKIISNGHEVNIYAWKGVGKIPKNLTTAVDATNRYLLDNLPKVLQAYGKTFSKLDDNKSAAVIVVCDLDNKNLKIFLNQLQAVLQSCNPQPQTCFCIAIEEGEAWFLGDIDAVKAAYPKAKNFPLDSYVNDAICGTWEVLANAIYEGGAIKLLSLGPQAIGREKAFWATNISPHMNIEKNNSPSFIHFRNTIQKLCL